MAKCTINRFGAAPCQCSSAASNKTRSPGWMISIGPPWRWHSPTPSVTNTVWPNGCLGEIWLGPFPDALLEDAIDVPLGLEARYEQTESISLAFVTAVQIRPA